MAITLSTGLAIKIAKLYAASKTVTAASNATSCVLTLDNSTAAIGVNDYVEVKSGWGLLNDRVVRVSASTSTTITLEGVDTSDSATKYIALGGTGSVRKISTWSEITQVKSISASGGDIQYADVTAINDQTAKQIPTIRNAVSMELETYDDPTLAWYADVIVASDSRTPYALRMDLANGSKLLANAYFSLQRVPSISTNEAMTTKLSLSYAAEPIRYAS